MYAVHDRRPTERLCDDDLVLRLFLLFRRLLGVTLGVILIVVEDEDGWSGGVVELVELVELVVVIGRRTVIGRSDTSAAAAAAAGATGGRCDSDMQTD